MNQLRNDPTAHAHSLPASEHNLEDTDETSSDSRYHSDQGSGAQVFDLYQYNLFVMVLWIVFLYEL